MSREVCGICWCPYDEDTGECACVPAQPRGAMNREDIIRMAREAECEETWGADAFRFGEVELERFFKLAYDAGRKAALAEPCPCGDRPADQCSGEWEPDCDLGNNPKHAKRVEMTPKELAASIKRGEKWKVAEPDLFHCPKCGGPADNGHDRSIPPSPYWCSRCMAEPVQEPVQDNIVDSQEKPK